MEHTLPSLENKVALVTGGAQRLGAAIVRLLHAEGMDIALHYRHSVDAAMRLTDELNSHRSGSVALFQSDLLALDRLPRLIEKVINQFGRLDAVINNASSFYATPVASATPADWEDLMGTNARAPFFIAQAAAPHLRACNGCIVNIADVHGRKPLAGHAVYVAAKAALIMLTRALARDLGPTVRVNAVAPGAILWPAAGLDEVTQQRIISRTALKRQGEPEEVARAVLYLIRDATYTSGEVLSVDGGRSVGG